MKRLLIITCCLCLFVPSMLFAFGEKENMQIQFNVGLIQGYNFTPAINDIPKFYAEYETDRLNSIGPDYFTQSDVPANYSYGVSFEPRVFFYFVGIGCNFAFQWSSESTSTISSETTYDEVKYTAQFFAWSFIPTVYFRPYWTKDDYFLLGVGIGYYGSTVITNTNIDRLTAGYLPGNTYIIDDSYDAKTAGYHFVIEYGRTWNMMVVNIGVAFDYTEESEFENGDGYVLYDWRNNETYKTEVLSFYFYLGIGLKI